MLTIEYLKTLLSYEKDTGIFTWLVARGRSAKPGVRAGYVVKPWGYRHIEIDSKAYKAHRLAFFYMEGRWPSVVDHVDRVPDNNAWNNLRECTAKQNQRNKTALSHKKDKVIKGVNWHKAAKKWQVRVVTDGGRLDLGRYDDLELAELIAEEAAHKYHGSFARV